VNEMLLDMEEEKEKEKDEAAPVENLADQP